MLHIDYDQLGRGCPLCDSYASDNGMNKFIDRIRKIQGLFIGISMVIIHIKQHINGTPYSIIILSNNMDDSNYWNNWDWVKCTYLPSIEGKVEWSFDPMPPS